MPLMLGTLTTEEAERLGYTLDVATCARLLTAHDRVIRATLRAPVEDASHLPSVLVAVRGPVARRVRPTDLEALAARLSLPKPGDLITPKDAVEILAGRRLRTRTAGYSRQYQWLGAAAEAGCLTAHRLPGQQHVRYSRREVQALAAALDAKGISYRSRSRARVVAAIVEHTRPALVGIAELAEQGINEHAARGWAQRGLYGATKLGGCWFFDRALVAARPQRPPRQPRVEVPCAGCEGTTRRGASEVQRAREHATARGREPQFFCKDCCAGGAHVRLRTKPGGGWKWTSRSRGRARAALRASWSSGNRDRTKAAAVMKRTTDEVLSSEDRRVRREDARLRKLHRRGLRENEQAEQRKRARSYRQRKSGRSLSARQVEDDVARLWNLNLTHDEIGEQLGISPRHVRRIAKKRGLPARRPGPRPARD
jgi:DNA-binding CsgD family transcriptional regulator